MLGRLATGEGTCARKRALCDLLSLIIKILAMPPPLSTFDLGHFLHFFSTLIQMVPKLLLHMEITWGIFKKNTDAGLPPLDILV